MMSTNRLCTIEQYLRHLKIHQKLSNFGNNYDSTSLLLWTYSSLTQPNLTPQVRKSSMIMKNLGGVSFVEQFRRFNLIILVTAGEFKKDLY